ncbi:hypothetical protein M0R01_03080 [bacterium]|nr:hypothetical protein [bacterium]
MQSMLFIRSEVEIMPESDRNFSDIDNDGMKERKKCIKDSKSQCCGKDECACYRDD